MSTTDAQVPPDIAAALRRIGPVVDVANTRPLYEKLFAAQREPYPNVTVARDVSYGADPLNTFDIFAPQSAPTAARTVVFYLHGGGFERGDKRMPGTPFYDNLMLWLARQGMVGVNMNYRLAPKHTWPAVEEDMAAAIAWVQAHIAQFGGNPERIVLWGESAGASLIAGYLGDPQFHGQRGQGVSGAVLNSGIYELLRPHPYFASELAQTRSRSRIASMAALTIPLFVSCTEIDLPAAISQAEKVRSTRQAAGQPTTYAMFRDHSHISQNYSIGTADTSVSGPILEFIRQLWAPDSIIATR
jgi:acetyl esterase/lipase